MTRKIVLCLFLMAAFFGFCYGALAIFAPQNLKTLSHLDRATLFSALRAGKMFLLGIPRWRWVVFGILLILSVIPIWALCAIAQIDEFVRVPPAAPKRPARSEESWREIWDKPLDADPVHEFKWNLKTGEEFNIMPDGPAPDWLTLSIKCEEKIKPHQRAGQ